MGFKRRGTATTDPFVFVGHGFGTSARCLECYAWFVRPPGKRDRSWIAAQLPFPVTSFARSTGALLHFGSDDDLEARVVAAYHPDFAGRDPADALEEADGHEPGAREWRAFCRDFERASLRIHERFPLVAMVKPDDGAYGRTPSRWHRRSMTRVEELATQADERSSRSNDAWSALARNLREELAPAAVSDNVAAAAASDGLTSAQRTARAEGKALLRAALEDIVVPAVRDRGFEGSFPKFRRLGKRADVLCFELQSGEYAAVSVVFSALAPRKGTTVAQDCSRAFESRNQRMFLHDMVGGDDRKRFWYESAAESWGDDWPRELASWVGQLLETKAERWLARRAGKR